MMDMFCCVFLFISFMTYDVLNLTYLAVMQFWMSLSRCLFQFQIFNALRNMILDSIVWGVTC